MHNIGRTVRETYEPNYESDHEQGPYQSEFDAQGEASYAQPYSNEFEAGWGNEFESDGNYAGESPFNEMQEMELASELLEVQSEEELEQFLSKLMSRGGGSGGARNFFQSKGGKMLGGVLKRVAKFALPLAGRVVGGMFGGPIGAKIGGGIGNFATRAFGLELEGMSAEDQEFALSRAFVRFGGAAARNVQNETSLRSQPARAVKQGVIKAARQHANGLLNPMPGSYQRNFDKGVYDHRDYEQTANGW